MSRELDVFLHFLFLAFALLSWQYTFPRNRHLTYFYFIGVYLLVTFIGDAIAATIMINKYLKSNLFVYHVLGPLQYVIIALMYGTVMTSRTVQKGIRYSIPVFLLLALIFYLNMQDTKENNTFATLLKHGMVSVFVLIYFRELIINTPYTKIYHEPIFWISLGFLFHSVLNVMLEGISNYSRAYGDKEYEFVYFLTSTSNYCLFLLFGIGFLTSIKRTNGK